MGNTLKILEQVAGALLILLVLLDAFLTVLYARMGTGILSARLARIVWHVFRAIGRRMQSNRGKVLSICGPTILVLLVLLWGFGLTLGTALILHPHLGASIKASNGETSTDFTTALFAGASSISFVGASSYEPRSSGFKMFYIFNSLVGMSVLSLTLTYLMQIYTALQRRNSIGLAVDIATGKTGDAATFVTHLGPQGRFESGYTSLVNRADSLAFIKEAHHFYPVLFYFRFPEPFYATSRLSNVALDVVTIIRAALDKNQYRWFIESGALEEIWDSSLLVLLTLEETFLAGGAPEAESPDSQTRKQWRARFFNAIAKLQAANIAVDSNVEGAANSYIALRSEWSVHIRNLAPSMLYSMDEIDPALFHALPRSRELQRAA